MNLIHPRQYLHNRLRQVQHFIRVTAIFKVRMQLCVMLTLVSFTGASNGKSLAKIKGYLQFRAWDKRQSGINATDMEGFPSVEHAALKHPFFTNGTSQMHHIIDRGNKCCTKLGIVEVEARIDIDTTVVPVNREATYHGETP